MSRIGNNPIKIPEGVQVVLLHDEISVKGKLGQLKQNFSEVKIDISEGIISVQNPSKTKSSKVTTSSDTKEMLNKPLVGLG